MSEQANNTAMPQRYSVISCGYVASDQGALLLVDEVAEAIDYILDDDELAISRLRELLDYLRR